MNVTMRNIYVICLLFAFSCSDKNNDTALFNLVDDTGIQFVNHIEDGRLENSFLFRNFYNGGGVAIGDINNDGMPDVFFTSNTSDNKLFLNKGKWKFDDITKNAGFSQNGQWSTGVVMADVNGDGWLDIYICNSGHMKTGNRKNQLYINNHDLTFKESAAAYGLDISGYCTQVSFFDYDMDGDLDCFMINNSPIPVNQLDFANRRELPDKDWPVADFLKGGGDHLFRNDNGHFTEVTREAGIHGSLISFGLGVSVGDLNGDGYPDVYVANDSYERDYLYLNQKNGTFKDELENCMQHTSFSSMGADIADINNDGYPDLFTTDMLPDNDFRLKTMGSFDNIDLYRSKLKAGFYHQYMQNCLQLNNKDGKFLEIANFSGVSATDWSWGALMFDADNDGYNDIFVCNGVNRDVTNLDFMDFFANDVIQKMILTGRKEDVDEVVKKIPRTPLPNKAFRNKGNLQFEDIGMKWGFSQPSFSNGAAYGDLDGDGDLDLVISNENEPAFIYRNNARELKKNNYITLRLSGIGKNPFAVGSMIKVYANHQIICRELIPSRGFQSSMDYEQVIGLGQITSIDSIVVIWPDASSSTHFLTEVNKKYVIAEDSAKKRPAVKTPTLIASTLFTPADSVFQKHEEDDYVDFYYERNIPKMLSREGPKVAKADVNGDGLADLYIGGTVQSPGQLYIQKPAGGFVKSPQLSFQRFNDFEDGAVLFFDADHDGDQDLLIGPAGNIYPAYSRQMQYRFFRNDGKGNFTIDEDAFPVLKEGANTAIALAYDIDGDGDLDLFIGGRSAPRNYGISPSSYLFINDGKGHFTDMTKSICPAIANIGMVTGAAWADVTGDTAKELIITGEWMPTSIFAFRNGHGEQIKSNLDDLFGWWQTVAAADLNGDGKTDLVLGNIGENFYLHPDSANPVKIFMNEFNQNGNTDKILTYTVNGKDMPVFLKHEMQDQVPSIKKQSLRHEEYAKKSIQELFPGPVIEKALVKKFNYTSSIVAINKGNGNFDIQRMPSMVQISSVNAVQVVDVNKDGYPDLVMGGNQFGFLPQFERLDASFGHVLINDGKGRFEWMGPKLSGLRVSGEVRDITLIQAKERNYVLFLRNNEHPALYEINDIRK